MIKSITLILLFGFSAFVSSACDFSTAICSSAGLSCSTAGSSFQVGNNTYGLSNLDVVSFNEATINNGDIQGRTAVRNNFYGVNGVSVADTLSDGLGYGLIVGGNLVWPETGAIYPLNTRFFIGGSSSAPSDLTSRIDSCVNGSNCLGSNFDSLYNYWNQFSSTVNSVSDNMVYSFSNGYGVLTCSASSNNYFIHISGSDFSQVTSFCVVGCNMDANFIITIVGDVTFQGRELQVSGLLVFNIINAATVTISTSVYAHIVAPNSDLVMTGGTIYGTVIAGNLSNVIQINEVTCAPALVPARRADSYCDSLTGPLVSTSTSSDASSSSGSVDSSSSTGSDASSSSGSADASTTGLQEGSGSVIVSGANTGSDNNEITGSASSIIASLALIVIALVL